MTTLANLTSHDPPAILPATWFSDDQVGVDISSQKRDSNWSSKSRPAHFSVLNPGAFNLPRSDVETARHVPVFPRLSGRVSKRKSRPSRQSQTTFITADAANFRQMVQQITGGALANIAMGWKPEMQVSKDPFSTQAGFLPTLDTSATLLDCQQQMSAGSGSGYGAAGMVQFDLDPVSLGDTLHDPVLGSDLGYDLEAFSGFPGLDSSWGVVNF